MVHTAGSVKKRSAAMVPCPPFPSFPSSFLSLPLRPFPICAFPVPGFPPTIQLGSLGECWVHWGSSQHCSNGSEQSPADKRFLVHSELKITRLVIVPLHKCSYYHARTGPATYHCDVSQRRSAGMVWSWPRKYLYGIPSHFQPWWCRNVQCWVVSFMFWLICDADMKSEFLRHEDWNKAIMSLFVRTKVDFILFLV